MTLFRPLGIHSIYAVYSCILYRWIDTNLCFGPGGLENFDNDHFPRLILCKVKEEADDDRRKEEFVPGNSGWPGA